MNSPPITQSARAVLNFFLRQLCEWEVKYAAQDETLEDDFDAWQCMRIEAREIRCRILRQYCDAALLSDDVLDACDFETPSCYDPDRDEISEIELGEAFAVFDYQQTVGLKSKFRFTLTRTGEQWRITNAEWGRHHAGKQTWEPLFI